MSKKRKYKHSNSKRPTKVGSLSTINTLESKEQINDKYSNNDLISLLRHRIALLDKKNIRLENKNISITHENNNLKEKLNYYQKAHIELEQENRNLIAKELKAQDKILSYENSMSFRLGYAIIFAFKEPGGIKRLLKTIISLIQEKRTKRIRQKLVSHNINISKQLYHNQSTITQWNQRRPVIQWIESDIKGTEFIDINHNTSQPLDKKGVSISIPANGASQLLLSIDVNCENLTPKQALVSFVFEDKDKNILESGIDYPFSQSLNKHYIYLNTELSSINRILLALPPNCEKITLNIQSWVDAGSPVYLNNTLGIERLMSGISVIVPTYQGMKTIEKCIESLLLQTLPLYLYEVIVVINGPRDKTDELLDKIRSRNSLANIKVLILEEAGVGKARNLAIQEAKYNYITFIDDDDFVSPEYLSSLYAQANYHSLVLTGVNDVTNSGEIRHTTITKQLEKAATKHTIQYNDVSSSLTMNACKLAPSHMVKSISYLTQLKSGEDVVYWSDLISKFQPTIYLVNDLNTAVYYRLLRENSVSRQRESFSFNVEQRLEVILHLIALLEKATTPYITNFIQSKINAQAGFIKRYLDKYPEEYINFQKLVENNEINNIFIREINAKFSKMLVISYCYAPYMDTSGIVMSKRVREMNKPVDIIYNSMDKVRSKDNDLLKISAPFIGQMIELKASQTFSNWKGIQQFSEQTFIEVGKLLAHRPLYETIYSRAMWPASHFAAALIKSKYPQIKWIAEFSDPLLIDVTGNIRYEPLSLNWLSIHNLLPKQYNQNNDNLFYWCEMLAYAYADELIFTNRNQLDYMLSYADENIRHNITSKAIIQPQPTLPRSFYGLSNAQLKKDNEYFYIGYFGSFYPNRGFRPFLEAWGMLSIDLQDKIRLVVYTQQSPEEILEDVSDNLKKNILIYPYVGYLDFLKLSDDLDALLVMDTITNRLKTNNPYLPSKLSDYLGSRTKIIALVEKGSPMEKIKANNITHIDISDINKIYYLIKQFLATS
ncbi:glycosyltransferase [Avibacterium sp. 21-594]|uniref:glycosyltransferase n=1 Tax=Avibacterium sp. 21-594 TaxID=2911535 RepID=UPI0022469F2F|nr:glycosyltransferase [Avibacterium sp. 21-594]MCW9715286.1 glycosyltransferase [Avibacterium sp. 21-594]